MASLREIQSRMKSIRDTLKITNAMYMISSSKVKKEKKMLADTEPFFYDLQTAIGRILRHVPEMEHMYFDQGKEKAPEERKKGYVVITADKGMAGAYNHNVIKMAEEELGHEGKHKLFVVGEIGRHYFEKQNVPIDTHFHYTAQNPTMHRARVITEKILELYQNGELDEVYLIYTKMESAVKEETEMVQILPLQRGDFNVTKLPPGVPMEEIAFSPSPEVVMDYIVPNYVTGFVFGALVESFTSEQNARMMAMEAATDNAKNMLRELSIIYNRARQAAITQEITEVISGARAQKSKH